MTIEEAIIDIKDNIKPVVGGISLDMTIDTMRKYQKIEQIMKKRYGRYHIEIVQEIKEVIEDGKID